MELKDWITPLATIAGALTTIVAIYRVIIGPRIDNKLLEFEAKQRKRMEAYQSIKACDKIHREVSADLTETNTAFSELHRMHEQTREDLKRVQVNLSALNASQELVVKSLGRIESVLLKKRE